MVIDGRAALLAPVCKQFGDLTFISRYEPILWSEANGYNKEERKKSFGLMMIVQLSFPPQNITLLLQRLREPLSCIIIFLVNILSLRHPSSNSPKPDLANWTLWGLEKYFDSGFGIRQTDSFARN